MYGNLVNLPPPQVQNREKLQDINSAMRQLNLNDGSGDNCENIDKTKLIVNYIPQCTTEDDLALIFNQIGLIESIRIMKNYKTGYSYGYGFVKYINEEDASKAIECLNGLNYRNKRLKVSYSRPPGHAMKDSNLYISNLPKGFSERDLDVMFSKYGEIIQKNVLKDKITGLPRGVAFVRFSKGEEAQAAITNLDGKHLPNSLFPLSVRVADDHSKQKGFSVMTSIDVFKNNIINNGYHHLTSQSSQLPPTPQQLQQQQQLPPPPPPMSLHNPRGGVNLPPPPPPCHHSHHNLNNTHHGHPHHPHHPHPHQQQHQQQHNLNTLNHHHPHHHHRGGNYNNNNNTNYRGGGGVTPAPPPTQPPSSIQSTNAAATTAGALLSTTPRHQHHQSSVALATAAAASNASLSLQSQQQSQQQQSQGGYVTQGGGSGGGGNGRFLGGGGGDSKYTTATYWW